MPLPTSRDITLNPGDPVPSALLNKLQDMIIGKKAASRTRWIHPSTPNILVAGAYTVAESAINFGVGGQFAGMAMGPFDEGDRLTAFAVRFLGTGGAGTFSFALKVNKGDGTVQTIGTLSMVNPPAAWALYSLTLPTPRVIASGESVHLTCATTFLNGHVLGPVGITSDRL